MKFVVIRFKQFADVDVAVCKKGNMKCPVCTDKDLVMSERQGIEIDYCPNCRGVWLDRGELDKIIEKSSDDDSRRGKPGENRFEEDRKSEKTYRHDDDYYKYKKRKSVWGELFDF